MNGPLKTITPPLNIGYIGEYRNEKGVYKDGPVVGVQ